MIDYFILPIIIFLFLVVVFQFLFFIPAHQKAITGATLTKWERFCFKCYTWIETIFLIIRMYFS